MTGIMSIKGQSVVQYNSRQWVAVRNSNPQPARASRGRYRTLNNQVWPKNTHGGDTNTRLCSSICGTEAGEDDGGRAAHRSEEGLDEASTRALRKEDCNRSRSDSKITGGWKELTAYTGLRLESAKQFLRRQRAPSSQAKLYLPPSDGAR
jgi:hypothetical protein